MNNNIANQPPRHQQLIIKGVGTLTYYLIVALDCLAE